MTVVRGDIPTSGNPTSVAAGKEDTSVHGYTQVLQPGQQETMFRGFEPSSATITRDRHVIWNRGTEVTGRATDQGDPSKDGPPKPSLRAINRSFNPQQGTDNSRDQDDLTRGYRTVQTGQWAGTWDGSTTIVYGGTPGMWIPYGSYEGYIAGPVQGIQGPVPGAQGDGPQLIPNSPPHGLHSASLPNNLQSLQRYHSTRQMRRPRVDRQSNSPIAGQSFSQTVAFQGQMASGRGFAREGTPRFLQNLGGGNWRGR
jgi:hypothetical protein